MNGSIAVRSESPFTLLDELLANGVICQQEHAEQCEQLRFDLNHEVLIQMRREDATAHLRTGTPLLTPTNQELQMNPKDLLNNMELNRKIMSEQLKALNGIGNIAPAFQMPKGDSTGNAAEMLNHLTNGHLNSAAQSVHALAGVAARVRAQWAQDQGMPQTTSRAATHGHESVIDVEVVEVAVPASSAPRERPGT